MRACRNLPPHLDPRARLPKHIQLYTLTRSSMPSTSRMQEAMDWPSFAGIEATMLELPTIAMLALVK